MGVLLGRKGGGPGGGGGGGSLPAWWTIDSTPGSESVEFAGAVEIDPGRDVSALVLRADPAQTEHIMRVYNDAGELVFDIDSNGNVDVHRFVVNPIPVDVGGAPGTSSSHVAPDSYQISSGTDAAENPLDIRRWIGSSFSSVFVVGRTGAIVRTNPLTAASHETAWEIAASSDGTGNAIEMWDNAFNNQLFGLTYTGSLDMMEQAEPAAPAANTGRLFVKDTAGKSQLLIRFPSGASQVIATEP